MTSSKPAGPQRLRRLLLSIHDVSPRHAPQIETLRTLLRQDGDVPLALLVVPDFWGEAPLDRDPGFARRLRRWADEGDEIFLHGFYHRDDSAHPSPIARLKARHMTAGEGEFLGIAREVAAARLDRGRRLVESVAGRPIAGFIAPAWLYGDGAHAAMAEAGIDLAEDHWRVWQPATGRTLARSPVVTWATRTRGRTASSLAVALLARHLPLPRVMRIGVHPGDCGSPAVMASIARTVRAIGRTHRAAHYRDLIADARCAS